MNRAVGKAPPTFVINLARQVERKRRMQALVAAAGVEPVFVEAVDGSKLGASAMLPWRRNDKRALLNAGEVGCLLSHVSVWERIVREGIDHAVVLEDDLVISPTFRQILLRIGDLPDFDLLRLETDRSPIVFRHECELEIAGHCVHKLLRGATRTGGYAISRRGAHRLLANFNDFEQAVDVEMFNPRRSVVDRLDMLQLVPAICVQAELVPGIAMQAPYLSSGIDTLGQRADTRLGKRRPTNPTAMESIRAVLRPIKRLAVNLLIRPLGQTERPIPLIDFSSPHWAVRNKTAKSSSALR